MFGSQYIYCRTLKGLVISSQICWWLMIIQLTVFLPWFASITFHCIARRELSLISSRERLMVNFSIDVSSDQCLVWVSASTVTGKFTLFCLNHSSSIKKDSFLPSNRFPFLDCVSKTAMSLRIYIKMIQSKSEFIRISFEILWYSFMGWRTFDLLLVCGYDCDDTPAYITISKRSKE